MYIYVYIYIYIYISMYIYVYKYTVLEILVIFDCHCLFSKSCPQNLGHLSNLVLKILVIFRLGIIQHTPSKIAFA